MSCQSTNCAYYGICPFATIEAPVTQCGSFTTRCLSESCTSNIHLFPDVEFMTVNEAFDRLLREVIIRFDTNPKNYQKSDYQHLIELFKYFQGLNSFGQGAVTSLLQLNSLMSPDGYTVSLPAAHPVLGTDKFSLLVIKSTDTISTQIAYTFNNGIPHIWIREVNAGIGGTWNDFNSNFAPADSRIYFLNKPQTRYGVTETFLREEDKVIIPLIADPSKNFDPLTYDGLISFYIGKVEDDDNLEPITVVPGEEVLKIRYQNSIGEDTDATLYLSDHGVYEGNTPARLKDVLGKQVMAYFVPNYERSCVLIGVEKSKESPISTEVLPERILLTDEATNYSLVDSSPEFISISSETELGEIDLPELSANKVIEISVAENSNEITIGAYSINSGDIVYAFFDLAELEWVLNVVTAAEEIQPIPIIGADEYVAQQVVPARVVLVVESTDSFSVNNAQISNMSINTDFVLINQPSVAQNGLYRKIGILGGGSLNLIKKLVEPTNIKTILVRDNILIHASHYAGLLTNRYYKYSSFNSADFSFNRIPIILKATVTGIGIVAFSPNLLTMPQGTRWTIKFDISSEGSMSGNNPNATISCFGTASTMLVGTNNASNVGSIQIGQSVPVGSGTYYTWDPITASIYFFHKNDVAEAIGSTITITINEIK